MLWEKVLAPSVTCISVGKEKLKYMVIFILGERHTIVHTYMCNIIPQKI